MPLSVVLDSHPFPKALHYNRTTILAGCASVHYVSQRGRPLGHHGWPCGTGRCPALINSRCLAPVTLGCPTVGCMAVMLYLYSSSASSSGSRKRITTGRGRASALAPRHIAVCWWNQEDLNCRSRVISLKGTPQTTSTA
ncbi:hypothetical protein MRX96_013639 [Rhipicephalus microplus]